MLTGRIDRIWAECSGSNEVREPGAYEETLSRHLGEKNECSMQIELDCKSIRSRWSSTSPGNGRGKG